MGSVFQRGDSWLIEYSARNGRIKRESLGKKGVATKTQKRLILNKREQKVMLKCEGLSDAEIPTLGDFSRNPSHIKKTQRKSPHGR